MPGPGRGHHAYYAPGEGPPVVVLQEYWGVTPQICGVADRLASEGFRVAVPDLYDGLVTDDRAVAHERMLCIDVDTALRTVDDTSAWLQDRGIAGPVGCVGFCMGGGLTLVAGASVGRIGAAVVFYGFVPWPDTVVASVATPPPFQLHYATRDQFAPLALGDEFARAITAAGGSAEQWSYDTGHAFMDETRAESYDPESAARAWDRTVDFLHGALSITPEEP
jgi:carboxymethylenebutenolidase